MTTIEEWSRISPPMIRPLYELYLSIFEDVNEVAVQQHVMQSDDFSSVMQDERIKKFITRNDSEITGIGTLSNYLETHPLLSLNYFMRRWPKHYEQRRIWYVGFIGVTKDARKSDAFPLMLKAMTAGRANCLFGMDYCRYNEDVLQLPRVTRLMLKRMHSVVNQERIDTQSFWIYNFEGDGIPA
jgi:hypothetical protein